MSNIANSKYVPTERPGSSTHFFNREPSNLSVTNIHANGDVNIRASTSPHVTKIVVGVIAAVVIVAAVATAVGVVLVNQNKEEPDNRKGKLTTAAPTGYIATTTPLPNIPTGLTSQGSSTTTTTEPKTTTTTHTTTTPTTTTTTTTTTTPQSSVAVWTTWGAWTSCTATCGSGIEKRYRTCSESSSRCVGDYIEQQVCSQADCPVYGKWDSWSSWGSCDVTCGIGQQSRDRSCTKTSGSDIDCVGDEQQQQVCSYWVCPDCSQTCSIGTLNTECDTCICESNVITGRVVSSASGAGISSAYIYATSAPTRMLTETNSTGFFTLEATCTMSELLLTREGFLDSTVTVSSGDMSITMTLIVLPYFTETPQNKYKLTGEDAMFCCSASGSPNILYYEWLKNSIILDSNLYPNGTHLYLTNVGVGDSGQYACRANSKVGAAISTAATLKVKDNSNSFCSDALQQKTRTLPDDCVQPETNTATYEVGECIAKRCRQDKVNETSSCRDNIKSCCGTYEAEIKTVACTGYDLSVIVVKSCHCTSCSSNSLEITGSALGVGTNAPLRFGEVRVNGDFTGYTSNTGTFSFSVTKITAKVIINLKDNYFNQFLETTKVLPISDDMNGKLHIDIRVFEAGTTVEIQSTLENTLTAGGNTANASEATVQISVPADSFYNLDGSPYTGTVSSTLTFLDPTNTTYSSDIPGVFTFMNDEGEETNLGSLGVFNLYFKDDLGNDLALNEPLDVYIPLNIGENGTTEEFKLWKLSTATGSWEIVPTITSSRRRKRSVTSTWIGAIDPSEISEYDWWNVDIIEYFDPNPCYFKFRVYKDSALTEPIINPSRALELEYHIIEDTIFTTYSAYTYNPSEECIPAICKNITGYVAVYYWGQTGYAPLFAADPIVPVGTSYEIGDEDKTLKLLFEERTNGPFYDERTTCEISSPMDNHMQFHYGATNDEPFIPIETYTAIGNLSIDMQVSREAFYPKREEGYRSCMVKVKLTFDPSIVIQDEQEVKIRVTSVGGTNQNIQGTVLGILDRTITDYTEITECMEYKCSGIIDPDFFSDHDSTKVTVSLKIPDVDVKCTVIDESSDLIAIDSLNESQNGTANFTFYAPTVYGPSYGIYSATSDDLNIEGAVERATSDCRSGQDLSGSGDFPDVGVAVTIYCENHYDSYPWYI